MDAVSLYPSINVDVAMKVCKMVAMETEIEIEHFNMLEATRFLMLVWTEEQARASGLDGYLPRRRVLPGRRVGKLGITTSNSLKAETNNVDQWIWPEVKVNKRIKKKIFALVVEQLVKLFCNTQTYTWRGRFYV